MKMMLAVLFALLLLSSYDAQATAPRSAGSYGQITGSPSTLASSGFGADLSQLGFQCSSELPCPTGSPADELILGLTPGVSVPNGTTFTVDLPSSFIGTW